MGFSNCYLGRQGRRGDVFFTFFFSCCSFLCHGAENRPQPRWSFSLSQLLVSYSRTVYLCLYRFTSRRISIFGSCSNGDNIDKIVWWPFPSRLAYGLIVSSFITMKSIDREAESKKCLQGEPRRALTKKNSVKFRCWPKKRKICFRFLCFVLLKGSGTGVYCVYPISRRLVHKVYCCGKPPKRV